MQLLKTLRGLLPSPVFNSCGDETDELNSDVTAGVRVPVWSDV